MRLDSPQNYAAIIVAAVASTKRPKNQTLEIEKKSFQMENQTTIDSSWRLSSVVRCSTYKVFLKVSCCYCRSDLDFSFHISKTLLRIRSEMKYLHIKSTSLSLISRLRFRYENWKMEEKRFFDIDRMRMTSRSLVFGWTKRSEIIKRDLKSISHLFHLWLVI